MIAGSYRICNVTSPEEAQQIVDFLFSPDSFDDPNPTPGEEEHFRSLPYQALEGKVLFWYASNEKGEVIGINCVKENEQQTGGFIWEYLAVHRSHRKSGIASAFVDEMFNHLQQMKARYLVAYTCSLPEYETIRHMFERYGFQQVGVLPDYYFEGEDRLIYYLKLQQPSRK